MVMLKVLVEKLVKKRDVYKYSKFIEDEKMKALELPADVKKGQFAVFATEGDEAKRFIVELDCLSNPAFLKLLEKAEQEFGFQQGGVLALPCKPDELKRALSTRRN
ncbi:hypothetical protein MKW94_021530 [Papaver nudicaule]|uniref:Uncharacterized protein n=1 Tax=Papaver nudicaule TaxID=74823 RepID=A0AA41VZW9_PAPNU|nr:hypothetical protein [Papaver nudicaule]